MNFRYMSITKQQIEEMQRRFLPAHGQRAIALNARPVEASLVKTSVVEGVHRRSVYKDRPPDTQTLSDPRP